MNPRRSTVGGEHPSGPVEPFRRYGSAGPIEISKHKEPKMSTEMEKRMRYSPWINVEQSAIDRGVRHDDKLCPISNAVCYTIPSAIRVEVTSQTIAFTLGDHRYLYLTPAWVGQVAASFDDCGKMQPFRFRLPRPIQVKPVVHRAQPYVRSGKYKTKPRPGGACTGERSRRWHGLKVPKQAPKVPLGKERHTLMSARRRKQKRSAV